jgi:hypothetical protein
MVAGHPLRCAWNKPSTGWQLRQTVLAGAVSGAVRAVLGWILDHCMS